MHEECSEIFTESFDYDEISLVLQVLADTQKDAGSVFKSQLFARIQSRI